ncbi:methyl-accepting chemotaxis protein [Halopiger goleimassiliensis]|uniref:methyl-accepting chemotaxis protein n=1 Tax=Halopiger goleimassiliensis TaxID=1293048 RepID=UPI0006778DC5|nr:methyl-accepting chemotaxis protein [Halopiger goleimassiliensis]
MDIARRLVPAAIRRRYAVKFGIVLLILGLSVGLIGFVATAGITAEVEDRVETDQTSFASQEAQGLQMWNEQNERMITNIAYSDVVTRDDPAAIEERFLEWDEHIADDGFAISYVDTAAGTVLASTDDSLRQASVDDLQAVDDDSFAEATTQIPWVSEPYVAEGELGEESAVITYVLSVPDAEDRAVIYTAELEAYGNRLEDAEGVRSIVVDGDNEIILDNAGYGADIEGLDSYEMLGESYDDTAITDDARTKGPTTRQVDAGTASVLDAYDFPDEDYVVSAARVHGTDWVIVTHEPATQAYGFVQTVNDWGTYATAGGVLLIGLIGAVLGRNTAVSIDRLTRKAGEMEEGNLDVDLETKRIDNIGRLYEGFDSMRVALREQIEEAEQARQEAEQERERTQQINDHLEHKADEYSEVMEAAAEGDLTARMDAESENEAMEAIAEDFNEMLEEIETTVAELSQFATDVATASEQVTASSEEVQSASEQVTESIQEISDGAERQNESLQSVNQEMSGLSTTTEEIAASSNEVADIAERTVETGKEGQAAARAAIEAMDAVESEAEDAVAEMRRLEEEVQQIDELINSISEIARQTNMLALNANIEASRSASGEDEEGFAVVAQEVKALSEDVADAADEAEQRLEAIRERTEQSTAEVEGTSEDVEDAGDRVQEAVEALEEIADLARETNVGVQEISAATEEQAASTQEVVAMVDEAATVSEQTTSEAQNVAAAAEEQTTALTEVTKAASNLSSQSTQLSTALDRFETDVEDRRGRLVEPEDGDDDADDSGGDGITLESDDAIEASAPGDEESTADEIDADEILGFDEDDDADSSDEVDDGEASADETAGAPATDDAIEAPAPENDAAGTDASSDADVEASATDDVGAIDLESESTDDVEDGDTDDPIARSDANDEEQTLDGADASAAEPAQSTADDSSDPLAENAIELEPTTEEGTAESDESETTDDEAADADDEATDGDDLIEAAEGSVADEEPETDDGAADPLAPVDDETDEGDDGADPLAPADADDTDDGSQDADDDADAEATASTDADDAPEETDADEADSSTTDDVFTFGETDDDE